MSLCLMAPSALLLESDNGRHLFDPRLCIAEVSRVRCLCCGWQHLAPLQAAIGLQVVQLVFWLAPNAWSITKESAWFGRFVAISGILRWTSINVVSCSTLASLRHHLISDLRCLCLKIMVGIPLLVMLHAKAPCTMPR